MLRQISLEEILETALQRLRSAVYHCMPGIVQAYNASDTTVDVQPAVNDVRFDTDTGERISEKWPVVPHVKVIWPKFGGVAISGQLVAGDKVILIGLDLDASAHMGSGSVEDPIDTRRHGGGYWIAFPGDITDVGALSPSPGPGVVAIGTVGGITDFAALASKVDTALNSIITTFNAHVHSGVQTGAGSSGPAATTIPSHAPTGSTTVKISP